MTHWVTLTFNNWYAIIMDLWYLHLEVMIFETSLDGYYYFVNDDEKDITEGDINE